MTNRQPRDCSVLEAQLWEINQRIALRQLESGVRTLRNNIDNALSFARAYALQLPDPSLTASRNIIVAPLQTPAHIQKMLADRATIQSSLRTSLQSAAAYSRQLETLRGDLSKAIDDLGPIAGANYVDMNLGDLEKAQKTIEDDLLRCYSETDKHINGQPHDPSIPDQPALTCWCGQNHGAHTYTGLMTCWCGTYNDYIGSPH